MRGRKGGGGKLVWVAYQKRPANQGITYFDKTLTSGGRVVRMSGRMNNTDTNEHRDMVEKLKLLIIEVLELEDISVEDIADDAPLFSEEGLGLDSIDAMELGVALKRRYNVTLNQETENVDKHFASVASLARFIEASR